MRPKELAIVISELHCQFRSELALITNKPRAASVLAVGDVTCAGMYSKLLTFGVIILACLLVLEVGAFERLLGPCMDVMKRNFQNYEEQLLQLFGTTMDITDTR